MARDCKNRYKAEVAQTMMNDFQYDNVMQVPKLAKVVINIGWARRFRTRKAIEPRWRPDA